MWQWKEKHIGNESNEEKMALVSIEKEEEGKWKEEEEEKKNIIIYERSGS